MTFGTMEVIQTITVTGATQAAMEFTSIPGTYDDLIVLSSLRSNRAAVSDWAYVAFNGSTANFSAIVLSGNGTTPISYNSFPRVFATSTAANATASTFGNSLTYIPNYARSNNKSWSADLVAENNATEGYNDIAGGLWSNTAAITSITMTPRVGTAWVTNSSATLYGITRVPAGAKATGGVIYDDASYWYHVFTSSGTFTPSQNITCDYLVVAGGGGGGGGETGTGGGGGGGAGGYLTASNFSVLANTSYTVTVGAGGSGGNTQTTGTNGSNSVFSTITSTGGGGGGRAVNASNVNANAGGSGGGGGGVASGAITNLGGAASPSGQGNAGGNSVGSRAGGGGGGSGAVGQNSTSNLVGGNGGAGTTSSISGTSVAYAGGGGAGVYNSGTAGTATDGGGAGGRYSAGTAGTANTGGGGGGGSGSDSGGSPANTSYVGAAGGSGIVIVRYTK